ncbi:MAG: hypothetical protein IAE79_17150 [Anaerolinea sp.]|nr:hypothetical protein [Anaerolinea sp.]
MWALLRGKLWIVYNHWRYKSAATKLLTLLILAGSLVTVWWGYTYLLQRFAQISGASAGVQIGIALVILLFFLVTAVFSLRNNFNSLYQTSDLNFLRVFPIPSIAIFTVKVLEGGKLALLPITFGIIVLFSYGKSTYQEPGFYLWAAGLLVGLTLVSTGISLALVLSAVRFLNPRYLNRLVLIAFMLMISIMILPVMGANISTHMTMLVTRWLSRDFAQGLIMPFISGLPIITLLFGTTLIGLCYWLYERSFYYGWASHLYEAVSNLKRTNIYLHPVERWARNIPLLPCRTLVAKEWLLWIRSPRQLLSLFLPLGLVGLLLPLYFVDEPVLRDTIRDTIYIMIPFFFIVHIPLAVTTLSTEMVAKEGRNFALLHVLPLTGSNLLQGKLYSVFLPMLISVESLVLGIGIFLRLPLEIILVSFLLAVYLVFGFAVSGITIGSIAATIRASEAGEIDRTNSGPELAVAVVLSLLLTILTILSVVWILEQWVSTEYLPLWWNNLRNFSFFERFFARSAWGILVSLHGLWWLLVGIIWKASVLRLEH